MEPVIINQEDRQREIHMMTHPQDWSIWPILPLKRPLKAIPNIGFLLEHTFGLAIEPRVYVGSFYNLKDKSLKELEVRTYKSFDDLLDNGWRVD